MWKIVLEKRKIHQKVKSPYERFADFYVSVLIDTGPTDGPLKDLRWAT
jgi:hypothetical protein